jgi:release factor glutamine methyltransferase
VTVSFTTTDYSAVVTALRTAGCVFAEDEAQLLVSSAGTDAELTAMVGQRVAGLPLEQILGWAEFCGLRIAVEPGVFVPRRRTEFLIRQAITLGWQSARPGAPVVVLDLCCGTGALGLAVARGLSHGQGHRAHSAAGGHPETPEHAEVHASDLDPVAVRCAQRNLAPVGGRVYQGDLFGPLPDSLRGRVDILTANVPYIPSGELELLPPEARLYEPRVALDGGGDGLALLRRVAAAAPGWLAPGGSLLSEVSERQAQPAREILRAAGLGTRVKTSEEMNSTVLIATRYGQTRSTTS